MPPLPQLVSLNVDTVHYHREMMDDSAIDKARKLAISILQT